VESGLRRYQELHINVKDGIIVDAKFKTLGYGTAIATSSMVTEMVKGKRQSG
jgi:nitrogen fixation NifU-like protein